MFQVQLTFRFFAGFAFCLLPVLRAIHGSDTRALTDGEHTLAVELEDAAVAWASADTLAAVVANGLVTARSRLEGRELGGVFRSTQRIDGFTLLGRALAQLLEDMLGDRAHVQPCEDRALDHRRSLGVRGWGAVGAPP